MHLSKYRRNEIAWRYIVSEAKRTGQHKVNFDSPEVRQGIRQTAEKLGISFEEAMEFARQVIIAADDSARDYG